MEKGSPGEISYWLWASCLQVSSSTFLTRTCKSIYTSLSLVSLLHSRYVSCVYALVTSFSFSTSLNWTSPVCRKWISLCSTEAVASSEASPSCTCKWRSVVFLLFPFLPVFLLCFSFFLRLTSVRVISVLAVRYPRTLYLTTLSLWFFQVPFVYGCILFICLGFHSFFRSHCPLTDFGHLLDIHFRVELFTTAAATSASVPSGSLYSLVSGCTPKI